MRAWVVADFAIGVLLLAVGGHSLLCDLPRDLCGPLSSGKWLALMPPPEIGVFSAALGAVSILAGIAQIRGRRLAGILQPMAVVAWFLVLISIVFLLVAGAILYGHG